MYRTEGKEEKKSSRGVLTPRDGL